MNPQTKKRIERRDKLKTQTKKEEKARGEKRSSPANFISVEEVIAKIEEIRPWLEEFRTLEINENTDIDQEETVVLIREMFGQIMREASPDDRDLIKFGEEIHQTIQSKKDKINELKKQTKKKLKQANKKLDLRHFSGSLAERMMELIAERNVELVKVALDRLWRKDMNGEESMKNDFEAIEAAKKFLREADSNSS